MRVDSLHPIGGQVVVALDEPEETTAGGLVIPEQAKERPDTGTIVAVGPGRQADDGTMLPVRLELGAKVMLPAYAGVRVECDDGDAVVVQWDDLLCVVVG